MDGFEKEVEEEGEERCEARAAAMDAPSELSFGAEG